MSSEPQGECDWDGYERRKMPYPKGKEHWHIKRELTAGHILTTILLVITIITGWTNLDRRVTIAETTALEAKDQVQSEIDHLREISVMQAEQIDETIQSIRDHFSRIENKLDRLIDRQMINTNGNGH